MRLEWMVRGILVGILILLVALPAMAATKFPYGPPEGLLIELEDILDPAHTALITIDMQNDFINPDGKVAGWGTDVAPSRAVIPTINKMIVKAREAGAMVVYACVVHGTNVDSPPYMARYAARGFDPAKTELLCQEGTWGAQLDNAITPPLRHEKTVIKYGYDAFQDTHLDAWLKNKGIKTVVYMGVNTDWCVAASLIHGFHLGYYVVVPKEAVETSSGPVANEEFLKLFKAAYGQVLNAEQILEIWQKKEQ